MFCKPCLKKLPVVAVCFNLVKRKNTVWNNSELTPHKWCPTYGGQFTFLPRLGFYLAILASAVLTVLFFYGYARLLSSYGIHLL